MLSMVAINMLLFVSKHFVYELPVFFFFSVNPHGGLCILPSIPPKIHLPKYWWTELLPWVPSGQWGWGSPLQTVETSVVPSPLFPTLTL